jgi:uncharacterized protein (DUF488 family)
MAIHTIGFTQKTAAQFFETLKRVGIKRLIDVRLNNQSQLAGFAKKEDLRYFLGEICQADYRYEPLLAPTPGLLEGYRKKMVSWDEYERAFLELLNTRQVENVLHKADFETPTVLLCSEAEADHCHRRLVAEYYSVRWGGTPIIHL